MKTLVINGLSARGGGANTYLLNFFKYLPEGNFRVVLIISTQNKKIFENCASMRVKLFEATWASKSIIHRSLWERFELPKFLFEENATVYYAPGGTMTTVMPEGVISATALRNMLPFDDKERQRFPLFSYIRFKLWLLRHVFLKSYKMADKVVFISEYSKSIVQQYIPNIDEKSILIPHGINDLFLNSDTNYELPDFLQENQFYLYVSRLDFYKAQKEIIQAWKKLSSSGFSYPIVLVGGNYNQYGEEVVAMIEELELKEKVFYLGEIDYEKLPGLYKAARVLIFASSCECCPNILLEKLAAGKPVVCSNIQPMPEFGEEAVMYFDPYDPDTLVSQIIAMEEDQDKMKELAEKAAQQALKFDWEKTVKKTVDFLLERN